MPSTVRLDAELHLCVGQCLVFLLHCTYTKQIKRYRINSAKCTNCVLRNSARCSYEIFAVVWRCEVSKRHLKGGKNSFRNLPRNYTRARHVTERAFAHIMNILNNICIGVTYEVPLNQRSYRPNCTREVGEKSKIFITFILVRKFYSMKRIKRTDVRIRRR